MLKSKKRQGESIRLQYFAPNSPDPKDAGEQSVVEIELVIPYNCSVAAVCACMVGLEDNFFKVLGIKPVPDLAKEFEKARAMIEKVSAERSQPKSNIEIINA